MSERVRLNETTRLSFLDELIDRKLGGTEKERLNDTDLVFHRAQYERLRGQLQAAYESTNLPESPRGAAALHALLVRLRLQLS